VHALQQELAVEVDHTALLGGAQRSVQRFD
jgi:hypothetical protein